MEIELRRHVKHLDELLMTGALKSPEHFEKYSNAKVFDILSDLKVGSPGPIETLIDENIILRNTINHQNNELVRLSVDILNLKSALREYFDSEKCFATSQTSQIMGRLW